MNFFKKTFILSLAFVSVAGATPKEVSSKKLIDKTVAVVNQDIILYSEFDTFKKGMEDEILKGKDGPDKDLLAQPEAFQKKILEQMIEDHLMEQEVRALGLEATDSQIENVVTEIMHTNGLQNRRDLERALRGEGLTYDEFVSEYKKRIGRSNLVNQIIRPKIKISEDEISTELKKRTQTSNQESQYQVGMIYVSKNNTTQKEMEKLRKSISSVADFSKVADQYTEGPGKGQGGDMGWTDPSDLQAPLNDTIKKMKKGNVSSLITTESGYYILACLDTKSKASSEETKIRNQIQDELMNSLLTKNLDQYIMDLKRKAHIEKFI
ncbi:MAG: SurA N-terminal domain-containing protein [Proteobacteria bacterium]|jgi:peptidyl-prolyl cis-trans isomerase SurA|nr:SurA N-terminal domain-containing protein [Pseudomonadota bacterium]